MALTLGEVEHIADLARLYLSDAEKTRYREQLSAILEYAESLRSVDTSQTQPTATVLPLRNVMRQDEVQPSLSPEQVLANGPDTADGCFRVLPILE